MRKAISKRLNTPWKRLVFVALCLPLVGSAASLAAAVFFWQQVYLPTDTFSLGTCHREQATRELNLPHVLNMNDEQKQEMYALAHQRLKDRFARDVRTIESSRQFSDCLRGTYAGTSLLNFEFAIREARNLFVVTIALFLVALSARPLGRLWRWVTMQ